VQIVQSVLGDDQAFKQASGDAFTTVVNTDMGKFSVMQMLAAYCDNILKVVLLSLC
jgi:GTP-dependent phosphoenolpyruvate carboxykinase